jgi:Uma2 family endonuclease
MVTILSEYQQLPTAEDLPDSDETPVDNELQNLIPNLLLNILNWIWRDSTDWFWGVDMGIYYAQVNSKELKLIVPDGFLALGVKPRPNQGGRLSYVLWEEKVLPILALEVVSKKYNNEYAEKLLEYQGLGILYYVVYNPLTGNRPHQNRAALSVYKLINAKYELLPTLSLIPEGEMVWMPEVELGIGYESGMGGNWQRDWLYWYDRDCIRYPTAEERATRLAEKLRQLGIDPDV